MRFFIFFIILMNFAYGFEYFDIDSIRRHVEERFRQTPVQEWPFPHMIIDNLLPDEYYQMILKEWPTKDASCVKNDIHTGIEIGRDGKFRVLRSYSSDCQRFFQAFAKEVMNEIIKKEVLKKLIPYFYRRFPCLPFDEAAAIDTTDLFELSAYNDALIFNREGFKIDPHVDPKEYFATALYYLPADYDHQEMGTVLNVSDKLSYDYATLKREYIKESIPIKYIPNRLLVLMQTPNMWHEVLPVHTGPDYIRNMYHAQVFVNQSKIDPIYKKITQEYAISFAPWRKFIFDNIKR